MDRHGPLQRGESSQHERTADGSQSHTASLLGPSPSARILALQRASGNRAVAQLIARDGFAPKELPRLREPVSEDFVSDVGAERASMLMELEARGRAKAAAGFASPEDLHQLDLVANELRRRRAAYASQFKAMKNALTGVVVHDDDRARVVVKQVLIDLAEGGTLYHVNARLAVTERRRLGHAMPPQHQGKFVEIPSEEVVSLFDVNFNTGEYEFPDPGAVAVDGPLEWFSGARFALAIGRAAVRRLAAKVARRAATNAARKAAATAEKAAVKAADEAAAAAEGAAAKAGSAAATQAAGGAAGQSAASTAAGTAASLGTSGITLRLLSLRNRALETAKEKGGALGPRQFGNLIDDEFKQLVRAEIDAGLLPARLKLATRGQRGADVWDPDARIGWDLTTATSRQVAGHDLRYLFGVKGKGPKTMRDGTRLEDVLPLVYSRSW